MADLQVFLSPQTPALYEKHICILPALFRKYTGV